ncbi:glutaredoxin family protein [Anaerosinus sp.]|uniref:glutaredoxin family protein n=1 Tax=Selenobaculum sp. TaxID=3074374 RepID=UPI0015A9F7F2
MVKVYSITTCPWCDKVKKYLKTKSVEFEELNIESDESARRQCYKLSGDLTVPVTTPDGENYVVGFDKDKLDHMLEI